MLTVSAATSAAGSTFLAYQGSGASPPATLRPPAARSPLQRRHDLPRAVALEEVRNVGSEPPAPIGSFAVGARQVDRDRLARQIVGLDQRGALARLGAGDGAGARGEVGSRHE